MALQAHSLPCLALPRTPGARPAPNTPRGPWPSGFQLGSAAGTEGEGVGKRGPYPPGSCPPGCCWSGGPGAHGLSGSAAQRHPLLPSSDPRGSLEPPLSFMVSLPLTHTSQTSLLLNSAQITLFWVCHLLPAGTRTDPGRQSEQQTVVERSTGKTILSSEEGQVLMHASWFPHFLSVKPVSSSASTSEKWG